ncbi:beta-amyloid protein [Plakobranchus ocellatus]|uniref:Beta-amyloid protein n=1 Tax=Plakobranchus ocellatus TaxID=259542 RepID=A0AAV3ZGE5_9GAST|nr:beta-amyloid protein [Plakobranchus ocellatus]
MASLGFLSALFLLISLQLAASESFDDKYEPQVAFICERPAMHRVVNAWIPDRSTGCMDRMEDILAYCQKMYPDHNITNVVEASSLKTIPSWPMLNSKRLLSHRVRPYRCLSGGFQSDALLVPKHCEFDHRHDQSKCEGFSHWNVVAEDECYKKGARLESFSMLLECKLGHFSGVEFVCCPVKEKQSTLAQAESGPDILVCCAECIDQRWARRPRCFDPGQSVAAHPSFMSMAESMLESKTGCFTRPPVVV